MATMKVALTTKPTPAQKYAAMNTRMNSALGGLSCIGAPVRVSVLVSGAGSHFSAGTSSTQAIAVNTNHCARQSSHRLITATATEHPAMPRPMPAKWMPSSLRWLWRISQFRISPVPSSIDAALARPAR